MKAIVMFEKTKSNLFKLKELVSAWVDEHNRYYLTHPRKVEEISWFHLYAGYTECSSVWLKSHNPTTYANGSYRQVGIHYQILTQFGIDIVDETENNGLKYTHSWVTSVGNQTHILVYTDRVEVLLSGRRHGVRRVFLDSEPLGWEYISSQLPCDASPYETNEEYQERVLDVEA